MDGKHRSFQEQVEKQPDYRYDVRNEIIINNDTMIFEEEYNVKVLMLNGSAKANGNTYASLLEVGRQLEKEGIEYEIFQQYARDVFRLAVRYAPDLRFLQVTRHNSPR